MGVWRWAVQKEAGLWSRARVLISGEAFAMQSCSTFDLKTSLMLSIQDLWTVAKWLAPILSLFRSTGHHQAGFLSRVK